MKLISGRKWQIKDEKVSEQIKSWLITNGGVEDQNIANPYEKWRIKYSDATITLYESPQKRTIFITESNDGDLIEVHKFIESLVGSRFTISDKKFLVGFDETGKGEVLGHLILTGVIFPIDIYSDLESVIGVADTKIKREIQYWNDIFNRIDFYKNKGLYFLIEKIPPWEVDKYNINKLLDLTYQRILLSFAQKYNLRETRIVLDDYGIGSSLMRYLNSLTNKGDEIIKGTKADEKYLEVKVASIISKYTQQKIINVISHNPEFQLNGQLLGSGNAGDSRTLAWLQAWYKTGRQWPWFIKRSFKTIQDIEKKTTKPKKLLPPINDNLLSREFINKFESGELNITSLSIVCPFCGSVSKSAKLIPKAGRTTAICPNSTCKKELNDLTITLRYYCGRVLPDTSVIRRGFLSKDLEGAKLFENFTILIHPIVKKQSDTQGGKRELERLGHFASIGRIRLEETSSLLDVEQLDGVSSDEVIQLAAIENNSILITADNGMKGSAQAKGLFVFEI